MHRLFVTRGLVLSKRGVGEANTWIAFMTEDLGLIRASARSTRVEKSKLRFGLEPLTSARYTFVQGRREWKLVGVEDISHEFRASSDYGRRLAGRVSKLLLRLIHGEEPVGALFATVTQGFRALVAAQSLADAESVEIILVLRILAHLGYVSHTDPVAAYVVDEPFSSELLARAAGERITIIRAINDSLTATGL